MSSATANTHANIKQVMRTALVGIAPADQLMLKGYLRVLLRLEADLEWVPANHPEVDLLFINSEFRTSDNIKKLLSMNPDNPVLYVQRDPQGNGGLSGDTLTIPLKELTLLSKWLFDKVAVLSAKVSDGSRDDISQRNLASNSVTGSAYSESIAASSGAQLTSAQATTANDSPNHASNQTSSEPKDLMFASSSAEFEHLMELAKLACERPEGLYELLINEVRVGLVNLKHHRLWLNMELAVFDKTWQLKRVSESEPTSNPIDLYQWLWSKVWQSPREALPLISDSHKYQIRYWPKPTDISNRSNLLRVFTALEAEPRDVNEIATLADTSVNTVKKVLAGLLVSGGLKQDAYAQLSVASATTVSQASTSSSSAYPSHNRTNETASGSQSGSGSALEDALQRRASGHSAPMSSSVDIRAADSKITQPQHANSASQDTAQSRPAPEPKTQKGGFLSRLRKKLGL